MSVSLLPSDLRSTLATLLASDLFLGHSSWILFFVFLGLLFLGCFVSLLGYHPSYFVPP